jgi:hypothetical protein
MKLIRRCGGVAIRRKRHVHEEAAHGEEEKGNSERAAISSCGYAAAAAAGAVERRRRWTGWGIAESSGSSGSPRWETSAREKVFSARGKDGARVRGQANVASDFGDGERRRLAFYAERSFRDTQLANLAN